VHVRLDGDIFIRCRRYIYPLTAPTYLAQDMHAFWEGRVLGRRMSRVKVGPDHDTVELLLT
jgi:hypothetical protein